MRCQTTRQRLRRRGPEVARLHALFGRVGQLLPEAGLRHGDVVRREETRWEDLLAAANLLAAHRRPEDMTLLFYHLDSQVLEPFSHEQLQEIIHRF